ncbi:FKBP-type peptidyl-prolyl cis-trans isomerase [Algoriphagus namhaensis]|uniref:Peptidyl-prolyl cis-trans isomerase n=1 Tax=Algoriphagus namhaensis TaxID=915353 RepID=A0ABV8AQC0_9BACT
MMRVRKFSLFIAPLFALGMLSCIDPDQTEDAILNEDKKAIAEYLESNPISSVQEFNDEVTGIQIFWQELSGSGVAAEIGDTLRVDYIGRLLTNQVFDTSIDSVARANNVFDANRNYVPIRFVLGRRSLIDGFEFAVNQMESGDKATVIMPSIFGYGSNPPAGIPIDAPLIFELDLLQVVKGPDNN